MAKILVVGGAGFLGHQVLKAWLDESPGNQATVFDALYSSITHFRMNEFANESRVNVISGDVRDERLVQEVVEEGGFDQVINLAGGMPEGPFGEVRRDALDAMARGSQLLLESMATLSGDKPKFSMVVSTAPWGNDATRRVDHGVSVRPASLVGVVEAVAMDVALGLGRELNIDVKVFVVPLAFGPHQVEGPLATAIEGRIRGQSVEVEPCNANWALAYAPDIAERILNELNKSFTGQSVIRLPGAPGRGWHAVESLVDRVIDQFFNVTPGLA